MKRVRTLLTVWLVFLIIGSSAQEQLEKIGDFYGALEKRSKKEMISLQFVQEDDSLVADYTRLSQIVLIRHGQPTVEKGGWRNRDEAKQFIKAYDSVGVYPPEFIPLILEEDELSAIHTSNLARTISTAQQVFDQNDKIEPDTLYREFERKIFSFPNIKMPLSCWLIGSRVLWYFGMNKKGIESRLEAKARSERAAHLMTKEAMEQGKYLLVAHGFFNRYVEKALQKQGWTTVYDGGNGYLAQKMLVKYEE